MTAIHLWHPGLIFSALWAASPLGHGLAENAPTTDTGAAQRRQEERRRFQNNELITARSMSFVFNAGDAPRIVWRDVDEVRRLGSDGKLRVRWFDAELNEVATPKAPGRWTAWVEGTAPNGTPVRRALTFYCRPPGFLWYPPFRFPVPHQSGPIAPEVWREHQEEISRVYEQGTLRIPLDSEAGAIFLAGLSEACVLGRAARTTESAVVRNEDVHLALKLKLAGRTGKVRPLQPPRRRANAAPVLHEGAPAEAGMSADAKTRIDTVLRAWAEDSGEPFVTLVARHGVIVTHEAFGCDKDGQRIGLDYRADVASITKTATAILFSRFIEQGLVGLDDSIATVFPDYPQDDPHVPTFRQCFTHTSGLSGHGEWGGARNPHLENVILNGIDANEPGRSYTYTGMGIDLAAKAMELLTGKSFARLYHEYLFEPLGMSDVPMSNASAGAEFTARDLATLAQWLGNRGSYGEWEFVSPGTFQKLMPEHLAQHYPGVNEEEGISMHWMRDPKPGAPAGSTRAEDLILSPRTLGHGSLSSCILRADLERDLIVVQIRRTAGPRFGDWQPKFLQAVARGVVR